MISIKTTTTLSRCAEELFGMSLWEANIFVDPCKALGTCKPVFAIRGSHERKDVRGKKFIEYEIEFFLEEHAISAVRFVRHSDLYAFCNGDFAQASGVRCDVSHHGRFFGSRAKKVAKRCRTWEKQLNKMATAIAGIQLCNFTVPAVSMFR